MTTCNINDSEEFVSPSRKYRLVVSSIPTKPGCWNLTKGKIYGGEDLRAEVERNYHAFPFEWVEDHPDGHSYLICGEDYQGQTVVQLDTGKVKSHLPQAAEVGIGFCWAHYTVSPDKTMIAVEGCYWAAPYEVRVIDFSDPMKMPWPQIHEDRDNTYTRWNEDNTLEIGHCREVLDIPGHPLHGKADYEMSVEELDDLIAYGKEHDLDIDGGEDGWVSKETTVTWRRPPLHESTRTYIKEYLGHFKNLVDKEDIGGVETAMEDAKEVVRSLISRCSPEDRAEVLSDKESASLLSWASLEVV